MLDAADRLGDAIDALLADAPITGDPDLAVTTR